MHRAAPLTLLLALAATAGVVEAGSLSRRSTTSPGLYRSSVALSKSRVNTRLRKSAPQITAANTATQIDPRRLAYSWNDENARHPVAQRPNMRGPLHRNTSLGTTPYRPSGAVSNYYLLSGRRVVTDRAGDRSFDTFSNAQGNWPVRRNVFYSNRTLVLRRHSFRHRR